MDQPECRQCASAAAITDRETGEHWCLDCATALVQAVTRSSTTANWPRGRCTPTDCDGSAPPYSSCAERQDEYRQRWRRLQLWGVGVITEKVAPQGSRRVAMRPTGVSVGGDTTSARRLTAASTVLSTSSTAK